MKYHKLRAGEATGTYGMEYSITEADILQMAQQLAMSRLSKGRALTEPKHVFSHLQTLLQYHEHEVFALLLLDTKHQVIGFRELFGGTPESAMYPRQVVKISLEHNAAAAILVHKVHNHPSGDPEPSQTDRALTVTLKNALNMIGTQLLDHVVVGYQGCCVSLAERGLL